LRRKQRRLCARKKGSRRRRKMARSTAQTHLKIERQRRDFHLKSAKRYVEAYRTIVVEDLNLRGLARSRLAKSILDAGWGAFLFILSYKAASAGGQVIRVSPRYTTQKCFKCGELVQKSLSVRTHICPHCGYVADRDINAASTARKGGSPTAPTACAPTLGVADESNVSRRRTWTRRKTSSQPSDQNQESGIRSQESGVSIALTPSPLHPFTGR
jgi:putative transposase